MLNTVRLFWIRLLYQHHTHSYVRNALLSISIVQMIRSTETADYSKCFINVIQRLWYSRINIQWFCMSRSFAFVTICWPSQFLLLLNSTSVEFKRPSPSQSLIIYCWPVFVISFSFEIIFTLICFVLLRVLYAMKFVFLKLNSKLRANCRVIITRN